MSQTAMHRRGLRLTSASIPSSCSRARRRIAVGATLLSDTPVKLATKDAESRSAVAEEAGVPGQGKARNSKLKSDPQQRRKAAMPVTVATLNDAKTMFKSLLKEYAYWVDDSWVTGTIPAELCGTYYRNGPGLLVSNPRYRRHTLDGDGMVFSLAFKDGRAYFRNRFVRTKGFVEEQAVGKPLHRNSFTRGAADGSFRFNPFDLNFKNVANTGVLPWGGQLYALWEAGLPHLMDPRSLDTLHESRMGGQIRGSTFSAHYRIVEEQRQQQQQQPQQQQHQHHNHPPAPAASQQQQQGQGRNQHQQAAGAWEARDAAAGASSASTTSCSSNNTTSRRLVTFSNEFGFGGGRARFYEFEESGRLLHETEFALPSDNAISIIHDLAVTEHYYVLVVGPLRMDLAKFATQYVLGSCSIAETLVFNEQQPARILLFPRPGRPSGKVLSPVVLSANEPFFVFHHVNAFEAGPDGEAVVLDTVTWDGVKFDLDLYDKDSKHLDCFTGACRTRFTRLTCDLHTGQVERRNLLRRTLEFPATDPRVTSRPHRVAFFIADAIDDPVLWGPAQSLVRVELDPGMTLLPAAALRSPAPPHAPSTHHHHHTGATSVAAAAAAGPPPQQLAPPRPSAAAAHGSAAGAAPGVAVDTYYFGDRVFPHEPMFVPRPGSTREGDGWVILGSHDAATQKGSIHIFDAENVSAGPLATLHLPHRLPVSLHGAWHNEYMGPDPWDTAVPRWQELGSARPL